MKKAIIRCISTLLNISIILSASVVCGAESTNNNVSQISDAVTPIGNSLSDYTSYIEKYDEGICRDKYVISAADFMKAYPDDGFKKLAVYENEKNTVLCENKSERLDYSIEVKESGFYSLSFKFFPINTDSTREEISVLVNGELPFLQAKSIYLNYTYYPEREKPLTNDSGDEYAPRRVVRKGWTDCVITNPDHDYDGAMKFWLEKGKNTISVLFSEKSNFVLSNITVAGIDKLISYKEYLGLNKQSEFDSIIKTEAEAITLQSDSTVIPVSEQSDPLCSPYSVKNLKINTIGTSWSQHGQWLEWEIDVEKSGWYNLSVRYKQNSLKGINVKRALYIDGEIPFEEAASLCFPYTSSWCLKKITDDKDNPYCFYLEEGKRKIRLEVVLAELSDIVKDIDDIVYSMNSAYRSVVMITSTSADKYRDYQIENELPELVGKIKECAEGLEECNARVEKLANGSSADSAILVTTASQLRSMIEDPDTIPYRLSSWESNIGSISSWALTIRQQPLQMDYFIFYGNSAELPKPKANIFQKMSHSVKRFFVSFIKDYSDMDDSGSGDKSLTVWLGTGRDQAEVLWQMTDELFTPESGIKVKVKLVSATMIEAFLSGRAPDVSIQTARDMPVNLAVRGALLDLSSFKDFDSVKGWFTDGALIPYTFQNCVYGIPDSQSFNMMFYRTDVLNELGLSVPQTWDEFVNVANQLHLKQLDTGVPVDIDISMYYTYLLQKGGEVFTEDLKTTLLDTQVSIDAFSDWTMLFTETGLPLSYNLFNRFRSGEMPLVIAPYVNYNQLASAAPEIRGLWEMTCIPGTKDENGNIVRKESATGTAAVVLASTKHPEEAWEFIKWWVGDTAQIRYAQDIESRVGTIGRVASANTKALEMMDYSTETSSQLMKQREQVVEIAQVPGNYYLDRDLLNAFRDVIYNNRNAKESILDYGNRINGEIERKRKELGIE